MLDLLLLLMVVIWGSNFAIVKSALADFPPLVFNALRLVIASGLFLVAMLVPERPKPGEAPRQAGENGSRVGSASLGTALAGPPSGGQDVLKAARQPSTRAQGVATFKTSSAATGRLTWAEWRQLLQLGVIGHLVYQLCFVAGVQRTSVGNAALIFGCTPVTVALLASWTGHERIPITRWCGLALSLLGIYAVVGHRASWTTSGLIGDVIVLIAMCCWSLYSVMSQPLLVRRSALVVTGWSMTIGATLYLMVAAPEFLSTDWHAISGRSWWLMTWSAVFSMALAYIIWYTAVQRIGSSRTAIYSNLTPIVAMIVGFIWLQEPITTSQLFGAAAILTGVFVTRIGRSTS